MTNQLKKGFSFPWVLFIISSSFLASCCKRRVSNQMYLQNLLKKNNQERGVDAFHEEFAD
jgi:hypothetical protein